MLNGLLVIDRIVLESIAKKEKSLDQIAYDTGLKHSVLTNTLTTLITRQIIAYQKGVYHLNIESKNEWYPFINLGENLKEEIKDLFISLVNQYFRTENQSGATLRLKKIWLTPFEEKLLNSHFRSLNYFFSDILEQRKRRPIPQGQLSDHQVIIWGHSKYSALLDGVLEAV